MQLHNGRWQEAIGASGTLRAVNKLISSLGWSNQGITPSALEKLVEAVIAAGHVDKLRLPDLNPQRAPVFPGGLAILYATFQTLKIERMIVSDGALREGLIYDLLGRFRHEDVRAQSVADLAKRFHADDAHAERITDTLRRFLPQTQFSGGLADEEEALQWLDWAARLHEIGLDIAHHQYHKHGAYIIENADLPGFSQQDQKLLRPWSSPIAANSRANCSRTWWRPGTDKRRRWLGCCASRSYCTAAVTEIPCRR